MIIHDSFNNIHLSIIKIGHSTCYDGKTCSMPCNDLTTGANCELCRPGYWGNPINGGTCQKCECNGMFEQQILTVYLQTVFHNNNKNHISRLQ